MTVNDIKRLIEKDKSEQALEALSSLFPDESRISLLMGQFSRNKNETQGGVQTREEGNVKNQRINIAILNLIKELNSDWPINSSPAPKYSSPPLKTNWNLLKELLVQLYKKGLEDRNIWERAGGDLATQRLNRTAQEQWFAALNDLKLGGGGQATKESLMGVMQQDFPNNKSLKELF